MILIKGSTSDVARTPLISICLKLFSTFLYTAQAGKSELIVGSSHRQFAKYKKCTK